MSDVVRAGPHMRLWRCEQCGRAFEADRPKCEKCGIDPAEDTRLIRFFTLLKRVHFDPPTKWPGIGRGTLACDPARKLGQLKASEEAATGEPSAVTCKACLASAEWQAVGVEEVVIAEGQDHIITVGPDGVITHKAKDGCCG